MGRDIEGWLAVLEVRAGYGGRGGAELDPLVSWWCLESAAVGVFRFEGGDRSRSFSRTAAEDGAAGAR
jgi:hypothetical protein